MSGEIKLFQVNVIFDVKSTSPEEAHDTILDMIIDVNEKELFVNEFGTITKIEFNEPKIIFEEK